MEYFSNKILLNIFNNIIDTESYKSLRLTCKKWNSLLPTVKRFTSQGVLIEQVFFKHNHIKSFNKRGELIKELIIDNFGTFIYNEYQLNCLIKTIKNEFPYKINMCERRNFILTHSECDVREKKYNNNYEYKLPDCYIQ